MSSREPMDYMRQSIQQATKKDIEGYKKWIDMDPEVGRNPFFKASNALEWVNPKTYQAYLQSKVSQKPPKRPLRASQDISEDIIIISDEEKPQFRAKRRVSDASDTSAKWAQPPKRAKVKQEPDVIEICDSDSENQPPVQVREMDSGLGGRKSRGRGIQHQIKLEYLSESDEEEQGVIKVTRKEKVGAVKYLEDVPERWPAATQGLGTAYVLDRSSDTKVTKAGKPIGLDAFLKSEDQDSWGSGTNGSTKVTTKLIFLDNLDARRSSHKCNGGLKCEFFDESLLDGYQRTDVEDMSVTQKIFAAELELNKNDAATVLGKTAAFYRLVKMMRCKQKGCEGKPVLKPLAKGPSVNGYDFFVGCTRWADTERYNHLYAPIPLGVDLDFLVAFMNGVPVHSPDVSLYEGGCATLAHPRHGKKTHCSHTHFRDGRLVIGQIVPLKCQALKVTYSSQDPHQKKLVVIFRNLHSHPPWPNAKPTQAARDDLEKCVSALGITGATGGIVNNANTTHTLLGMDLSTKHEAFRDKRLLRDKVRAKKEAVNKDGLEWKGVVGMFEADQKQPSNEQYIRYLRMDADGNKVVVTMNTVLANLTHEARYLVCDFTFKRVRGDLNEWEVVIWHEKTHERVTVARVYCNSATAEAFAIVFEGFFSSVKKATGRELKFKVFDPAGNLLSIHLDMEAAQVQGLGKVLMQMNDPAVSGINERNPDILVQHVGKWCTIHYNRGTENLVPVIGVDAVKYLNHFPNLKTQADIDQFHSFCQNHPSKDLQNWYKHKMSYPWLFNGLNGFLSPMPPQYWNITPSHTNLVESAHVATNRETSIRLLPVEAIVKARKYDAEVAVALTQAEQSCILRNRNNSETARLSRKVRRDKRQLERRNQHNNIDDNLDNAKAHLAQVAQAAKDARAEVKELTEKKKAAGRTPRHNRDRAAAKFSGIQIPPISSSFSSLLAKSTATTANTAYGCGLGYEDISNGFPLDDSMEVIPPYHDLDASASNSGLTIRTQNGDTLDLATSYLDLPAYDPSIPF